MSDPNPPDQVSIEFMPNGPMLLKGSFQLSENGQMVAKNGPGV